MAATQKDIAKKLNISPSLVSRVLSGKAREVAISEKTIALVKKLAQEMGYTPNTAAQSLKGISSRTIGVMVSYFDDPFFGQLLDTILNVASVRNYTIVLTGFHPGKELTTQEFQSLMKHHLDGIIIVGSSEATEWMHPFRIKNIPLVRIGHGSANEFSTRISINSNIAMRLLLEHLQANNCSRIAFMGHDVPISHIRKAAFEQQAKNLGLKISKNSLIETAKDFRQEIKAITDRLLNSSSPAPNAVVCSGDTLALYLLAELTARKISVPKDIAVTGINDCDFAKLSYPKLTTIRQPIDELVTLAFAAVANKFSPQEILLDPQLIIRESSLYRPKL